MGNLARDRTAKPVDRRALVPGLVSVLEADFAVASWPQRYHLLEEIFDYLEENSRDRQSVAASFAQIVEQLVSRTGDGDISCREQAHIYAASAAEHHRQLAGHWFARQRLDRVDGCKPAVRSSRQARSA